MSYKKICDFCKQEIIMNKDEKLGRWYPSDINGGTHYCEGKKTSGQDSKKSLHSDEGKPQLKNLLEVQLLVEEINKRLKRVERIVVDPRTK